jgi:5-methylcytosine-specific restriction protein A
MGKERDKKTYKAFWNNEVIDIVSDDFIKLQGDYIKFAKSTIEKLNLDILDNLNEPKFNNAKNIPPIRIRNIWNNNGDIYLNILRVRTSGTNSLNFRVPFEKKQIHDENSVSISVAFLNVGNKYIYAISSNLAKRRNTELVSYSSVWFRFDDISKIVRNKVEQLYIKSEGLVFKLTDNIEEFENNLIEMISFDIDAVDNEVMNDGDSDFFDNAIRNLQRDKKVYDLKTMVADFIPSQFTKVDKVEKLIRNQELKNLYLQEHQKCELCNVTETFVNAQGLQYFEVHHFIPYNNDVQHQFKKTLDSYCNLVSLCPNCHRKIHLANKKDQKNAIDVIYKYVKANESFLKTYQEFNLEELYKIYTNLFGGTN